MSKKSIKGFLKTKHFKIRQDERKVSDLDVKKALTQGKLVSRSHGHVFQLNFLQVTVNLDEGTLITVHPGDPSTKRSKILSSEEARELKKIIEQKSQESNESEDDFLKYVSENAVKKLR